jgi:hypothetical protein
MGEDKNLTSFSCFSLTFDGANIGKLPKIQITYSKPNISLISNVTGKIATAEIATPSYWVNHISRP